MGQRLQPFNLDFGGFSRGAGRLAQAGQIEAEGTSALGAGVERGANAIAGGITRKKDQARQDAVRREMLAREDAQAAKADARYADERDYRRKQDQDRKDAALLSQTDEELAKTEQQIAAVQFLAQGQDADPTVVAGLQELTQRRQQYASRKAVLEGRLYQGGVAGGAPAMGAPAAGAPAAPQATDAVTMIDTPLGPVYGGWGGSVPGARAAGGRSAAPVATAEERQQYDLNAPPTPKPVAAAPDPLAGLSPLQRALAQAEQLRQAAEDANRRASGVKDDVTRNRYYDRATQLKQQATVLEAQAGDLKKKEDEATRAQAAAREAEQSLRAKKDTDRIKREDDYFNARAAATEYERVTGEPWDGAMNAQDIRAALADYRARDKSEINADRVDARAQAARDERSEKARVEDERRDAAGKAKTAEAIITDAEQDFNAKVRQWQTVTQDFNSKAADRMAAKKAMDDAERALHDIRERYRGGAKGTTPSAAGSPEDRVAERLKALGG